MQIIITVKNFRPMEHSQITYHTTTLDDLLQYQVNDDTVHKIDEYWARASLGTIELKHAPGNNIP